MNKIQIKTEVRKCLVEKISAPIVGKRLPFPTQNSAGLLIYPTEEGIRNFWRWFGNSYVVDRDGRPLVMYHGTTKQKIQVFHPSSHFGTSSAANERMFFFPEDDIPKFDDIYKGANIMPVYLSIQNPLRIRDHIDWTHESLWWDRVRDGSLSQKQAEAIQAKANKFYEKQNKEWEEILNKEYGVDAYVGNRTYKGIVDRSKKQPSENKSTTTNERIKALKAKAKAMETNLKKIGVDEVTFSVDTEEKVFVTFSGGNEPDHVKHFFRPMKHLIRELEKNGYDGLIYQNEFEDFGKDSYIAFYPNQIKSAIGNKGSFSKNSRNILESNQT